MTKRTRCLAVVVVAFVLATTLVRPADAADPVRKGTIVGGWFPFAPFLAPGGPPRCEWNADCIAWLESGCSAALAGRDPSLLASIEDVHRLARPSRLRTFWVYPKDPGIMFGDLAVEFWTRGCERITYRSISPFTGYVKFAIPAGAAWMTVSSVDMTTFRWELWR